MKFQHEQAEASDVGSPAPEMPDQILFQLVGRNLFPLISKGSSRFSDTPWANVISGRRVTTVVIEERADVEEVVNIVAEFLEIAGQLRRAVDVSGNHVECRNARLSQVLFRHSPGYLVKVGADENQWVLL